MSDAPVEEAAKEFSAETTKLAEQLVSLTIKDAQALVDCLKEVHGIEPAGGAIAMAAMPAGGEGGEAAAEEQTEFSVVLKEIGDKGVLAASAAGDASFAEAVVDRLLREAVVVLLSCEALLLRSSHDLAVAYQSGGAVVVVRRYPQDVHAPGA